MSKYKRRKREKGVDLANMKDQMKIFIDRSVRKLGSNIIT